MFSILLSSIVFALSASALTIETRDGPIIDASAVSLPSGWKLSSSCAVDDGTQRVFSMSSTLAGQRHVFLNTNTPKKCLSLCAKNGYGYAALRLGTECWCGSSKPKVSGRSKKECNQECSGDKKQSCGGVKTSQVYTNSRLAGSKPSRRTSKPKLASGWSVVSSCVNDPTTGENFFQSTSVFELANNTPLACTTLCRSKGYKLAGVEYSNECVCGKGYKNGKKPSTRPSSECNMGCPGDNRITCGAGHRVQLYKHSSFKRDLNSTIVGDDEDVETSA
ncbi:hypothetical protein EXIGLDRAFT_829178 [Exidia glandulosa HHB12029]|uniref:WSC domain-containing protein n=1 Tax=Exidia glandulosa HHB12029 TaxID=1314781 RepID=A0A165PTR2_EXIGL|nr:hypothetical protein EXIGLDRAFT_829178 [Exidia glandulosa HHB12029]